MPYLSCFINALYDLPTNIIAPCSCTILSLYIDNIVFLIIINGCFTKGRYIHIPISTFRNIHLFAIIETQLTALADVKQAEATYVLERGESQQATKDRDAAFAAFEKWVREFYAIAKIALEDKPQLLESIGKFVRS